MLTGQLERQAMPCQIKSPENRTPPQITYSSIYELHMSDIEKYYSKRMQKHSPDYIGKRSFTVANREAEIHFFPDSNILLSLS